MNMNTVFAAYLLLIVFGMLWNIVPGLPSSSMMRKSISSLVIYLLLPLLIMSVIAKAPLNDALWQIPLTGIIVTIGCLLIAWMVYALLKRTLIPELNDATLGSIIIGASWCNATYLGLPIITSMFGDGMSFLPVFYDVLALTPLLWSLGVGIAGYYQGIQLSTQDRIKQSISKILTLPPLYAVIFGLLLKFMSIDLPDTLMYVSDIAGKAVPPIMMISVGMALTIPTVKSVLILIPAIAIRLLIAPILAGVCIMVLGIESSIGDALIVEAGMPTMVLTLALIDMHELDAELLSHLIATTTMASFITLQMRLFT